MRRDDLLSLGTLAGMSQVLAVGPAPASRELVAGKDLPRESRKGMTGPGGSFESTRLPLDRNSTRTSRHHHRNGIVKSEADDQ